MAVNGVRSSWEATAAKSRADSSAALVRCCSLPMRASIPSTASAISTASRTPRTWTSSGLDWALIARACWASSRKGLTMINEITQPTTTVPPITLAQISNTRRCSSLIRCWASASGAANAIEAGPAVKVRTRYCTPLMVVLA